MDPHSHKHLMHPSQFIHPAQHYYYPHPHPQQHPWIFNYPTEGVRHTFAIQSGLAEVTHTHDYFTVKLEVNDYSPDELVVKTDDEYLIIEGKHEEKQDEHGLITRSFKRRFPLPIANIDKDDINPLCEIGADGVLTVKVPKKVAVAEGDKVEKVHAIKMTGK